MNEFESLIDAISGVHQGWLAVGVVTALYLLLDIVAWGAARRRTRDVYRALADSTRSLLEPADKVRTGWLAASIAPAPDPFRALSCEFTIRRGGMSAFLTWPFKYRKQSLVFHGALLRPPRAEIVWEKSQPPDRALGRGPASSLWTARQVDFLREEYAVRGANTAALEHAFGDLQGRFGAFTLHVQITAGAQNHMTVALACWGLNSEELPALVGAVSGLARASQRE